MASYPYVFIPYDSPATGPYSPEALIAASGGAIPVYGGPPGPTAPPSTPKGMRIGIVQDGAIIRAERGFIRFKISDLPGALPSVRLELQYLKKANPTGDVALIDIEDFGTLDVADYGIAEYATITAAAITPVTVIETKLSLDVTARYNAAKAAGRTHLVLKLQYSNEAEGVAFGRWYMVGATGPLAPQLVVLITAGQDVRTELLATAITPDLAAEDALGSRAAVIRIGDGFTYPHLGEGVRLAVTVTGLLDDGSGTYTGIPSAPITRGPDIIQFLWRSATEGAGLALNEIDLEGFTLARARLTDWFELAGGLTDVRDVREWVVRVARSCRSATYLDQLSRETIATDPVGGSGLTPVRLIRPWEHGTLRLFPLTGTAEALYPISRVEVFWGWDYLGLAGWQGHGVIAAGETDPPDPDREAQAADAHARYATRELSGLPAAATGETGYEWVPLETPGGPTGVRIRDLQWDRARRRPSPVQGLEVRLPRFALRFRLGEEFSLESDLFPSAAARLLRSRTPMLGSTELSADAYQVRRARCSVRGLPMLSPETGTDFPVIVTAQINAWETV